MRPVFYLLLVACIFSCKKDDGDSNSNGNNLGAVNGTWVVSSFGGVNNNTLKWSVNGSAITGIITELGSSTFNFAVGDEFLRSITVSGTGTYTASGKYTYGSNNQSSGYRPAQLTLQSNSTQLQIVYPALDANFPEIVYIFQKQ